MSDRTALTDIVPSVRQEPQHNQSISSRRSRYFLATSVTKKLDHNAQTHTSPERRSFVNEVFSILLDNRAEVLSNRPHICWLFLPMATEQVQSTLNEIHIHADNQQDCTIAGISASEGYPLKLPENLIQAANVDELNFLFHPTSKAGGCGAFSFKHHHEVPAEISEHRISHRLCAKHRLLCPY